MVGLGSPQKCPKHSGLGIRVNPNMSPEMKLSQKETLIFQPQFVSGELLVSKEGIYNPTQKKWFFLDFFRQELDMFEVETFSVLGQGDNLTKVIFHST